MPRTTRVWGHAFGSSPSARQWKTTASRIHITPSGAAATGRWLTPDARIALLSSVAREYREDVGGGGLETGLGEKAQLIEQMIILAPVLRKLGVVLLMALAVGFAANWLHALSEGRASPAGTGMHESPVAHDFQSGVDHMFALFWQLLALTLVPGFAFIALQCWRRRQLHATQLLNCAASAVEDLENSGPQCRICLEQDGELIAPCGCQGTLQYVHRDCVTRWAFESASLRCELCRQPYDLRETKREMFNRVIWAARQTFKDVGRRLIYCTSLMLISMLCVSIGIVLLREILALAFATYSVYTQTPLCFAAMCDEVSVVPALISAGANVDMACMSHREETPLFIAARNGYESVVFALISAGASVDLANKHGVTPLFIAATHNNWSVVYALISAGARADLDRAAKNGHESVVSRVLGAVGGRESQNERKFVKRPSDTSAFAGCTRALLGLKLAMRLVLKEFYRSFALL